MDARDLIVTRRSFLRRAIALGGGLTLASLVAPAGAPAVAAYAAAGQTQSVTIKFWKSPHSDVEQERVGKVIQGFEAQYPNIQVEHTITDWPSWDETYTAAFASGSPPDVAYMPDQYFVKFAEAKQVADLSQWTEGSDYASEKAAWYPDSWATGEYKGTRVAIPNIGVGFPDLLQRRHVEAVGLT
jgi:multiple sugar transport system substrate-binding protein